MLEKITLHSAIVPNLHTKKLIFIKSYTKVINIFGLPKKNTHTLKIISISFFSFPKSFGESGDLVG